MTRYIRAPAAFESGRSAGNERVTHPPVYNAVSIAACVYSLGDANEPARPPRLPVVRRSRPQLRLWRLPARAREQEGPGTDLHGGDGVPLRPLLLDHRHRLRPRVARAAVG